MDLLTFLTPSLPSFRFLLVTCRLYNQQVEKKEIKIHGETIGIVDEYVYLGQLKTSNARLTDEINRKWRGARLED